MRSPRTLLLGRAPEPLPLDNAPARHRRPMLAGGRHRPPPVNGVRTRRLAVALLLVLASAGPASVADRTPAPSSADPAAALAAREDAIDTASRSSRPDPAQARPGAAPLPRAAAPDQRPPPPEPEEEEEEEEEPAAPGPVGGLDQKQMERAATIVWVGQDMGLPEQASVVALATALQESQLRVLASTAVPESYSHPNDGVGSDHDSVGLFQQRPSMGWGTVADCMDPESSARTFYAHLQQVSGWKDLPITVAAQTVQVSAFPDHYAKHESLARQLVAALA
ncbi:MAG: hypothetical protein GEV12_18370 [Micromonosporaceae bacterium]|nr:hypothetical protein [Micromonosporaceae bacterium]